VARQGLQHGTYNALLQEYTNNQYVRTGHNLPGQTHKTSPRGPQLALVPTTPTALNSGRILHHKDVVGAQGENPHAPARPQPVRRRKKDNPCEAKRDERLDRGGQKGEKQRECMKAVKEGRKKSECPKPSRKGEGTRGDCSPSQEGG
jgi:hypothetical protein